MFGGTGNDIIDGGDGDDELNGGEGNDILKGGIFTTAVGNIYQDVLRGGPGKDKLYGGTSKTMIGGVPAGANESAADFVGSLYMYGDEDHDELWGSKNNAAEYLWGGEGDDFINPGQEAG